MQFAPGSQPGRTWQEGLVVQGCSPHGVQKAQRGSLRGRHTAQDISKACLQRPTSSSQAPLNIFTTSQDSDTGCREPSTRVCGDPWHSTPPHRNVVKLGCHLSQRYLSLDAKTKTETGKLVKSDV